METPDGIEVGMGVAVGGGVGVGVYVGAGGVAARVGSGSVRSPMPRADEDVRALAGGSTKVGIPSGIGFSTTDAARAA